MREGGEWVAFVGVALSAKPGSKLRVEAEQAGGGVERFEIDVARKAYASQHLKVPPDQVDLSAEHLARYERERAHLSDVLRTFTDSPPVTPRHASARTRQRSSSFGCAATSMAARGAPQRNGHRSARRDAGHRGECGTRQSTAGSTSSRAGPSSSITGRGSSRSTLTWKPSTRPWHNPCRAGQRHRQGGRHGPQHRSASALLGVSQRGRRRSGAVSAG